MTEESTINFTFTLDKNKRIINTKIQADCSHRDMVVAAMYLLNEAVNRVNTDEDKSAFPSWIIDAFDAQAMLLATVPTEEA